MVYEVMLTEDNGVTGSNRIVNVHSTCIFDFIKAMPNNVIVGIIRITD